MFFVPQILKDDCGMAALKMLLADAHNDRNYLFIPQDEEHGSYSYEDLIAIAHTYNVELIGFKAENMNELATSKDYPFIATIKLANGAYHAVYVYKIKNKRVYYMDPLEGKMEVHASKFIEIWDGSLLKIKECIKTPCPYKEAKPIRTSQWVVLSILQVLCAASAIAGVFFINENAYIFLPIALFALAIILEIALKAYSVSVMKGVDTFFYEALDIKDGYTKTLRRFERYKHGLLTSLSSFLITFLITLALIFIVLNNDLKNFLLIASPLIAASIEGLFYRPYLKRGYREVVRLEDDLDNSEDLIEYRTKVYDLHKQAYKYGKVEMFKRYIGLALFVAMAVVLMAVNGMVSFPYVIFYLCIQIAIYHCFKTLLDYPSKCEETLKEKVEINNCLHQTDENK